MFESTVTETLYFAFAVFSLFLIGLQLVFGFGDFDFDLDGDDGSHRILSLRTGLAWLAGFGFTGSLVDRFSLPVEALVAAAGGVLFAVPVYGVMVLFARLRSSGNIDYSQAAGQTGETYTPVGPHRTGQITVELQGHRCTLLARTEGEYLQSFTAVRVVRMVGPHTAVVDVRRGVLVEAFGMMSQNLDLKPVVEAAVQAILAQVENVPVDLAHMRLGRARFGHNPVRELTVHVASISNVESLGERGASSFTQTQPPPGGAAHLKDLLRLALGLVLHEMTERLHHAPSRMRPLYPHKGQAGPVREDLPDLPPEIF